MAGKFGSVESQKATMWLRAVVPRKMPIQEGLSLRGAGAEPTLHVELLLVFSEVQLLPTSTANIVPDPASGVPTKPPGAFTVSLAPNRPLLVGPACPGDGMCLPGFEFRVLFLGVGAETEGGDNCRLCRIMTQK